MPDLILHHYPMSPFSQKMRSMFGYAGLPWQSVTVREFPPRPHLAALAGGYRKVPVAQDGADVFCDSRIIAEEIAARAGKPELALGNCSPEAQAWVAKVDLDEFFACVLAAGNRTLRRKARESMSLPGLLRFAWDRIKLGRTATTRIVGLRAARPAALAHAARVEAALTQDFLFGATPNHADFSTYHSLWMIRDQAESRMLKDLPRLNAWMDRMQALGDGRPATLTIDAALAIARQATPRAIPAEHRSDPLVGRTVTIAPSDYAQVPSAGVLAGATPTRWILAREDAQVGTVHVHFPREGYTLQPTER
ncbi:MAG: glutathione S-transferase family protein [Moraxellaceae bacterium]|jgi:glutathione S-transferase|nr:glutathione S-transferase family protein [Moraxellaceae bacterium]